jgi:hypothetical protein
MKNIEKASLGLHIFCGIGALAGGSAAILDPVNPMGMITTEVLQYSPFKDFLIPGLFLFTVLGLGNLLVAFAYIRKWNLRPWISGFFASAMVCWIVIQCLMLMAVEVLHVIFFLIGAVQGLLALTQLIKK